MILAALQAVDKHYGGQTVLAAATLELRAASRIALVGRNGAGKTTVLRLLAGLEPPDGGQVFLRGDVEIGVLEQDPAFEPGETVLELCSRAFAPLDALEAGLRELEGAGLDDPQRFERWERLHERFERRGGYERRARRDAVLHALGFRGREEETARHLSGGERTRLGLARLLMAQPDVLLLDEPTNHLDIEMRAWLEGFLGRTGGAALIVSHDRAFLDGACDRTAEVSRGRLRVADGNPSAARGAWEEQDRIDARTRANQEKELARLESAAAQMKSWAGQNEKLHRRARSMERRAERYAGDLVEAPLGAERSTRFRFDADPSGAIILQAEHLSKGYGTTLFEDLDLTIRAGERIALVGPNGAGKTTLLRVLLGEAPSDDPRARLRFGARVRVGYYDQQLGGIDPERTLFEEVVRLVGDVEAHNLLGRFLFPYDAQFKRIADLSGGERARLALLKLSLGNYNVLVLDEPTNHLDVEMIEALEAALARFEGTLVMVSHDRRFIEAVADRVWDLRDGRLERYEGDWRHYLRKFQEAEARERARRQEDAATAAVETGASDAPRGPSSWQLEREREELEGEIARLETDLAAAADRLAAPEALTADAIADLGAEHAAAEAALLAAMARWEEIEEELASRRAGAGG